MLRNQFLITLRTLWRDKGYTFINVLGLSVGLTCAIIVSLYIEDELTFDRMHSAADRTYRAVETQDSPAAGRRLLGTVMGPVGPALKAEIPQVEETVRLLARQNTGRLAVGSGPNKVYDGDFFFAEESFFRVFDFPLIAGDRRTALEAPRSVVLTESVARRHFGEENPVGKDLEVERYQTMRVTGLMKDPPPNSHLSFSMLISMSSVLSHPGWLAWSNQRDSEGFLTYVKLRPDVRLEVVQQSIARTASSLADTQATAIRSFFLQPMTEIHFGSGAIEFDFNQGKSDRDRLYIFGLIGAFIVLIACVNYTNLATARSMRRAREVGIRKVSGADRTQLFLQFMGESFVFTASATLLALLLQELVMPYFNALSGKALALRIPHHLLLLLFYILGSMVVATLAGVYPAFVMSRFRPSVVLKGSLRSTKEGGLLRRGLVAFQFMLSVAMIVATIVVYRQLAFVSSKDLGFKRTQMVVVDINSGNARTNFESIKNEFRTIPGVKHVATSSRVPGEWKNIPEVAVLPVDGSSSSPIAMPYFAIDPDFLQTFEIPLIAGRNFTTDRRTDSTSILLNETAASMLGGPSIVGREVVLPSQVGSGQWTPLGMRVRVIGVVRDYHYRSLFEPIGPAVFGYWSNPVQAIDYFTASIVGRSAADALPALRAIGERYDPTHPFEYNILDDRWSDFYEDEQRASTVFTITSVLSVLISCLGLIGLASYAIEQRTKEVGIRKVLGATASDIVGHLSKEFVVLVAIGNAIAWPVAYYLMKGWLENFAYRTELGVDVFLIAGGLSLAIAFFSVAYRAVRAAVANPVESLRYE